MDEHYTPERCAALAVRMRAILGPEHAGLYPAALENAFPRVLERIVEGWGGRELDAYLDDLMLTQRPGRQGFPEAVMREIFQLAHLHDRLGLRGDQQGTAWDWADDASFLESRAGRG